jgi:hypothetical protein
MNDRGLSEEGARSYIAEVGYNGRVANVMRDCGITNEEEARSYIGEVSYAATILAIMAFFSCNEKKARSMFAESGGKASGENRRISDSRKECATKGCNRLQKTQNTPLCQVCSKEMNKKRKSEEVENEINRCVMCGRTDNECYFKTKVYCERCYRSDKGKTHRKERKKETKVLCDEPDCNRTAVTGGKCRRCCDSLAR